MIVALYLGAFGLSALLCFGAAVRARRIRASSVRCGLIALLLTSGVWAAADLGLVLARHATVARWAHLVGLISGFSTIWAWLYFCSAYAQRSLHRSRPVQVGAAVVFLFVTGLKVTNPVHGLYFHLRPAQVPFVHWAVEPGLLYWMVNALAYALAAGGYALILPAVRNTDVGRGPLVGLIGLTALPLALNAAGSLSPYLLQVNHDALGVAAFAVGILFVYSTYFEDAYRLRRDAPAVVVGEEGRIRACNAEMQQCLPPLRRPAGQDSPEAGRRPSVQGERLEEILPGITEALRQEVPIWERPAGGSGDPTGSGEATRFFQVAESRFGAGLDRPGRLLVFSDVTGRERQARDRASLLEGLIGSIPGVVFRLRVSGSGEMSLSYVSPGAQAVLGIDAGAATACAEDSYLAEASLDDRHANDQHANDPNANDPNGDDLYRNDPRGRGRLEAFARQVPAGHRERLYRTVRQAGRRQKGFQMEVPFRGRHGKRCWLLGAAEPEPDPDGDDGEAVQFAGVCIDITDRKEAERKRRRSEIRFRAVTEQAVDVIGIFGPDGTIEYVSPSAERVTGRDREALTGTSVFDLAHPDDEPSLRAAFRRAADSPGTPVETTERILRPDGGERVLSIRARRPEGGEGPPRVIANIRDVTEQRRRREELVQAKETAEEAARLKTAVVANMSHEVRTPLTSIIGFAEILAEAGLEEPHAGFAGQIYESGQRLQETLDTMLDLSRLEAGEVSPRPAAVDVAGLVTEVVREWEEQALRHDVDLTMDREEDLPPLSAGEEALRRVVTNLLANAIKFTPAGGSVRVCLRRERPPSERPPSERDPSSRAERVVVEVEDTGIGMDPSFAEQKAFEAFQQESVGTDREYEGTGLGLAIVDRYADLLGASVSISTRKGEGTTVTVSIPLDPIGPEDPGGADPDKTDPDGTGAGEAHTTEATHP